MYNDYGIVIERKAVSRNIFLLKEAGINYKKISTTMPYLHSDKPERIEMLADAWVIDQVIDWFGKDLAVRKTDDPEKIIISLWASPCAMSLWALQYINYIEVLSPAPLRDKIRGFLQGLFSKNKTDETTKLYHSFVRLWCG